MSPERIAPEQFGFKNSRPTISSDCYALGMVIYETISGYIPFHKDTDLTVFLKVVVKGEHPPQGAKFAKSLWRMLERCWASKPDDRPSIEDVLRCLEVVSNLSEPPSPGASGGFDEDGGWDSPASSSDGESVDFFATDDRTQLSPADPLQDNTKPVGRMVPPPPSPVMNKVQLNWGDKPGEPGNRPESSPGQGPQSGQQNPGQSQQPLTTTPQQGQQLQQLPQQQPPANQPGQEPPTNPAPATPGAPPPMGADATPISWNKLWRDLGDLDHSYLSPDPVPLDIERDFGQWFNPGWEVPLNTE